MANGRGMAARPETAYIHEFDENLRRGTTGRIKKRASEGFTCCTFQACIVALDARRAVLPS